MQKEESIGYARYADDLIFAIKSGVDSEGHRFRQFFQKALKDLKLAETSLELIRGRPRKTRVWGLLVSINLKGTLIIIRRAPLNRWKRKLTLAHLMMKMGKKKSFLTSLQSPLLSVVLISSVNKKESAISRTLSGLEETSFSKPIKKKHPQQERKIAFYVNRLPHLVMTYQIKMRQKGLYFWSKRKEREKKNSRFYYLLIEFVFLDGHLRPNSFPTPIGLAQLLPLNT